MDSEANALQRPSSLAHPNYRSDIDGLRAIAVLSVVAYHAYSWRFTGGFIGVDIFFVISGFLISSIIFSNLQRGSWSFIEFYSRRIRRIFPALILVLCACYAFAWFTLLPDEYKQLGAHMAGGAGFISNLVLWRESGYFDTSGTTKPLLHLWSLGIEEQFYIIWPSLLWLAWRLRINLFITTLGIALISWALNIYVADHDSVADFYSPQTRFWELLLGALLAYVVTHAPSVLGALSTRQAHVLSFGGIVAIALGLTLITSAQPYPGWGALLPTVGAVLLIAAGPHAWVNRHVLSHRIMVWFGLISYPLYLWHWPLLSFAQIMEARSPSKLLRLSAVVLAILLAWLTYRILERPFRSAPHRREKAMALLATMIVVGLVGFLCNVRGGYLSRLGERQAFFNFYDNSLPLHGYYTRMGIGPKFRDECNFYDIDAYDAGHATRLPLPRIDPSCYERRALASRAVFLWGDSHAQHLNFGLQQNLPPSWQILQVASSGCEAEVDNLSSSSRDYCVRSNWFALQTIASTHPNVVIVAQNHPSTLPTFRKIAKALQALGIKRVVFVGPTPHWNEDLPRIVLRKFWHDTPRRTFDGVDDAVLAANSALRSGFGQSNGVYYADLIDVLCNQEGCLTYLGGDRTTGLTSFDYGHLTPMASSYVARNLLVPLLLFGYP